MKGITLKIIGNVINPEYVKGGFAGTVYDSYGLAPTITVMQGGGRQPMIIVKGKNEQESKTEF